MGISTTDSTSALKSTTQTASAPDPLNSRPPSAGLPQIPVVKIEPNKAWSSLELRDLWVYRELLYFLVWRDVKIRYKQTLLGAAWAILQPLLTMLIFTLIFSKVAKIDSDGI